TCTARFASVRPRMVTKPCRMVDCDSMTRTFGTAMPAASASAAVMLLASLSGPVKNPVTNQSRITTAMPMAVMWERRSSPPVTLAMKFRGSLDMCFFFNCDILDLMPVPFEEIDGGGQDRMSVAPGKIDAGRVGLVVS